MQWGVNQDKTGRVERKNNDGAKEGAVPLVLFFDCGVPLDFDVKDLTIKDYALRSREVCPLQDILHGSGYRVVEIADEISVSFRTFCAFSPAIVET